MCFPNTLSENLRHVVYTDVIGGDLNQTEVPQKFYFIYLISSFPDKRMHGLNFKE